MLPQHAQAPPTRTGSERLWAQEQPWAMRQPWAPSKDGRGVALLTPCSDPRPGDPRAYAPSCCKCWLLLAPSTETLSGDSPWLKTAALPKPHPCSGQPTSKGGRVRQTANLVPHWGLTLEGQACAGAPEGWPWLRPRCCIVVQLLPRPTDVAPEHAP